MLLQVNQKVDVYDSYALKGVDSEIYGESQLPDNSLISNDVSIDVALMDIPRPSYQSLAASKNVVKRVPPRKQSSGNMLLDLVVQI